MLYKYRLVPSMRGVLAVVWEKETAGPRIKQILLPKPGQSVRSQLTGYTQANTREEPQIDRLCGDIARFLEGQDVSLGLDLLDLSVCTPFQWQVLTTEYQIPRGRVRTYHQLANKIGNPAASRAVGNALAHNPFPIVIPCHRAIRSDGTLGGYQGGLALKRALLEMEGITFDHQGRVPSMYWEEDERTG